MYYLECDDEWNQIHPSDLWIYNKLFLSRCLGYTCGPAGTTVPKPDFYIIRPSFNLFGMSRFARVEWIEKSTDDIHPSEFWCEIFKGEHLSVDYHNQQHDMTVLGIRNEENPIYKWDRWEKIDKKIEFPDILNNLKKKYEWINCEFIDSKLIEVHFRRNPDFRYGNSIAVPVWKGDEDINFKNMKYIEDSDFKRSGFWIK
jgi:hypothetical protein